MDGIRDDARERSSRLDTYQDDEAATQSALGPLRTEGDSHTDSASKDQETSSSRTWQQELPRWLASLDSERTRREYEKAVGYFFHIPGVPESLDALTFDLLLAYRGSLALRAERTYAATGHRQTVEYPGARQIVGEHETKQRLPSLSTGSDAMHDMRADDAPPEEPIGQNAVVAPLAPATVNIRLTALRQFLAHCGLWGFLPDLSLDRMRAALRRLRIERRRPYQVLAEPEWAGFLRAARAANAAPVRSEAGRESPAPRANSTEEVLERTPGVASITDEASVGAATSVLNEPLSGHWWGIPRANRARQQKAPAAHMQHPERPDRAHAYDWHAQLPRSPAGLTGVHTGQRDHALLALALATGLRAIELCSLDLGDLTREWNAGREEWWLVLPDAKTKGQHGGRTLPLAPELVATLLEYAAATGRQWGRATDRAMPLFLSRHAAEPAAPKQQGTRSHLTRGARGRLSPQQVRRIVDRVERQWLAAQQGGQQNIEDASDRVEETRAISPHALRHSTAVALLEGNERSGRSPASVEHVRGWLGHFDIRTTQGYLAHLDARRHRRPFVLQPVDEPSAPHQATSTTRHSATSSEATLGIRGLGNVTSGESSDL